MTWRNEVVPIVADSPVTVPMNVIHPPDDVARFRAAPDRTLYFTALGMLYRLETDSDEVEAATWSLFESSRVDPDVDLEPDVTIRLLADAVPEDDAWLPLQPIFRAQDHYVTIAASRQTILTIDTRKGFAYAFLSPQVRQEHEFLRVNIIQSAVYSSVEPRFLAALHAAIVRKNGKTLILRGLPGAGKSTLAYASLVNGFSLVTEDASFVRRRQGRFEICGIPWSLYLLPDANRFFPEVAQFPLIHRFSGYQKYAIDVGHRFPGQTIEIVDIGPVVFVARSDDGTDTYRALDEATAIDLLDQTAIGSVTLPQTAERDIGLWEEFLAAGVYLLEIGPDPIRAARLLDALVKG